MSSFEAYGRYQLLKKLATGGMAQIYLARQVGPEGFEKLMVVKRILPHLAENEEFITMFLDEARIAARLNHPNVVQIFDLGALDDSFFIAMEYIHGEDVRRVWKRAEQLGTPLPLPLTCRIVIEACAGLDYAHKKADQGGRPLNIVHRDISPQNILVSFDGHVKIVDFGIAKAADQATVTRSGVLKGKYSYMSPEQAGGKPIDARSDIFAVGVVLYELLTQTRLFKRGNDIQTLNAVTGCDVQPPHIVNPKVPADLSAIVMKSLAREREERYAEARLLQADLEEWLLAHKLPSSSAQLAGFMESLYAERLAREAEEGRLLLDSLDSQGPDAFDKATPARESRPTRSVRTGGARPAKVAADATSADRPRPSSVSRARVSGPQQPPPTPPAPAQPQPPRAHTEQSVATQAERRSRVAIGIAAVAVLVAAGTGGAWYLQGGAPQHARVTVSTEPAGAQVRFDGRVQDCVTPCQLAERPPGTYPLSLSKAGYATLETRVQVPEGAGAVAVPPFALSKAEAGLAPPPKEPVTVRLTSQPPGAAVTVKGEAKGATPLDLAWDPGAPLSYALELDGYEKVTDELTVGAVSPEPHAYTLKPLKKDAEPVAVKLPKAPKDAPPRHGVGPEVKPLGTVRFVVKPWASVECGSMKLGDTPFPDQPMPVGEYVCTFANPDFPTKRQVVKVEANAVTRVQVSFNP